MKIQVGDAAINWLALQPQTNHKEVLLVAGDSVRPVGTTGEGQPLSIRDEIESAVFDSHSVEMILRLLPLEVDYQAEISVYHAVRQAQMMVPLHVFNREKVTDARGSIATHTQARSRCTSAKAFKR